MIGTLRAGMLVRLPGGNVVRRERARARGEVRFASAFLRKYGRQG